MSDRPTHSVIVCRTSASNASCISGGHDVFALCLDGVALSSGCDASRLAGSLGSGASVSTPGSVASGSGTAFEWTGFGGRDVLWDVARCPSSPLERGRETSAVHLRRRNGAPWISLGKEL